MTRNARPRVVVISLVLSATMSMACVPPEPPPTTLRITTELTICGGVIPPPGEPWCRTRPVSRTVEVSQRRTVVATGTSSAAGVLTVVVPPGALTVTAPGEPIYLECESPRVTAVANVETAVTHSCTLNAP